MPGLIFSWNGRNNTLNFNLEEPNKDYMERGHTFRISQMAARVLVLSFGHASQLPSLDTSLLPVYVSSPYALLCSLAAPGALFHAMSQYGTLH